MTVTTITADEAIQALRDLVADRGVEYVYRSPRHVAPDECVYFDDETGHPSCGVGFALSRIGVPVEALWNLDVASNRCSASISSRAAENVLWDYDFALTEEASVVLYAFQAKQDAGRPWGEALLEAESRYQDYRETV